MVFKKVEASPEIYTHAVRLLLNYLLGSGA